MSSASGAWKWRSSERLAFSILERLGYEILEVHKRVVIDGVEVAEVDAVARGPDGELYAVEVKAGRVDVNAVRQAFSNAALLGYKPLVVGRGFADKAAEATAKQLGVRVVNLPDEIVVDVDELERAVEEATWSILERILEALDTASRLKPGDHGLLEALASSETFQEFAEKLGVTPQEAARRLADARRRGVLPRGLRGFAALRGYARLALSLLRLKALLDALGDAVERLERVAGSLA